MGRSAANESSLARSLLVVRADFSAPQKEPCQSTAPALLMPRASASISSRSRLLLQQPNVSSAGPALPRCSTQSMSRSSRLSSSPKQSKALLAILAPIELSKAEACCCQESVACPSFPRCVAMQWSDRLGCQRSRHPGRVLGAQLRCATQPPAHEPKELQDLALTLAALPATRRASRGRPIVDPPTTRVVRIRASSSTKSRDCQQRWQSQSGDLVQLLDSQLPGF